MSARALHQQQTQAARGRRTSAALRRGKLVEARSEVWPKRMAPLVRASVVGDGPIRNSNRGGRYDGAELRAWLRPGASDHERHPSRIGNRLHYRDGLVETMA